MEPLAGTWGEFGWWAALTCLYCLLAVMLCAVARREALNLSAHVARTAPGLRTWRGLAGAAARLWE